MKNKKNQLGVGLVEVLVALVLLAIGVLGFTALQLRAVDATSEALTRSQATLILRGLTESIRANPNGQSSYPAAVKGYIGVGEKSPKKNVLMPHVHQQKWLIMIHIWLPMQHQESGLVLQ